MVEGTSGHDALASTQAYALRQLDGISEKSKQKADLGEIAKATRDAGPEVREWLAVRARTLQLQDGVSVLDLECVLDASPGATRQPPFGTGDRTPNRPEVIGRSTARLLAQMDEPVRKANCKVLLNPFDSPAAVKWSNQVATGVLDFHDRLGSSPATTPPMRSDGGKRPARLSIIRPRDSGPDLPPGSHRLDVRTATRLAYQQSAVRKALDPANPRPRIMPADRVGLGENSRDRDDLVRIWSGVAEPTGS